MKKMLLVAAASAAVFTSSAFAMMNDNDQFYLKLEGGGTIFNKTKDNPSGIKMKSNTSGIVGAGVGFYVMENVRSELTFDFLLNPQLKKNGAQATQSFGAGPGTLSIKHKGRGGSLLLSGYVDFFEAGGFKIYAGAGIGVAQLSEKATYTFAPASGNTITPTGYTYPEKVKKVYNFAYQLGAGVSAAVADGVNVELGYSWRDYGKTKSKTDQGYAYGKTRYKGHNLLAGLRFDI